MSTKTEEELIAEREITSRVRRMSDVLNESGFNLILRVMEFFSRGKRGELRGLSVRLDLWRTLDKYPPEQIAIACEKFTLDGHLASGKKFEYFMGIINGSAHTEYNELRAKEFKDVIHGTKPFRLEIVK